MVDGPLGWEGPPLHVYTLVGVELLFDLCGHLVWGKTLFLGTGGRSLGLSDERIAFLLRLSPK